MNIARCYELFLTDRKISRCSEATLRFYDYVIGKLIRYIEENNLDSSVESTHHQILPFLGLRNYTIIRLFLDTGMRLSELSRLQLTDASLEDGFVSVLGGLQKLLHPFLTKYSQSSTFHPPS